MVPFEGLYNIVKEKGENSYILSAIKGNKIKGVFNTKDMSIKWLN